MVRYLLVDSQKEQAFNDAERYAVVCSLGMKDTREKSFVTTLVKFLT
jgi:hypothetical protein